MKTVFEGKARCCGCGACYNRCPVGAIEMKADEEGFLYPAINEEMCVSCDACRRICPFADVHRVGDVTIADYWGVEKYVPEWNDPRGVSLILVSTEKGRRLLECCQDSLDYEQRPPEEALAEQPRLRGPVRYPAERDAFWARYWEEGLDGVFHKSL